MSSDIGSLEEEGGAGPVVAIWKERARSWARRRRRGLLVVAGVLVVVVGQGVVRSALGPTVPVHLAQKRLLVQRVVVTGRVRAPARIQAGSVVAARVVAVPVDQGARVKAGELLVQLDDAAARAAVAQAEAAVAQAEGRTQQVRELVSRLAAERLDQAQSRRAQAEDKLRRTETLFATEAATVEQRDDAQRAFDIARSEEQSAAAQLVSASPRGAEYRQAQAALAEAQAALAGAQARLADMRIVAPAGCVVIERDVEPGDVVQPGRPLLVLARDGDTELVVEPDEKNLAYLAVGQKALASADAFPSQRFEAVVTRIAPAVDAARGTIEVRLGVAAPPPYLRPDMTVSVDIEVARRAGALVLPADAVHDLDGREPWVLVVAGGRVERRAVGIGIRGAGHVEVVSGLALGDAVVPASTRGVAAGQRVRAKPLPPEGAGAL